MSKRELRKALERTCRVLTRYASAYSADGDPVLSELLIDLQEILRATAGPTEMQQFKKRLYALLFEVEGEHPTSWFSIPKKHMEDLFAEFGYGGQDGQ